MSERSRNDTGGLIETDLIHDWNSSARAPEFRQAHGLTFLDETLRDGIQSPSVVDPMIDDKLRLLHLASDLGIQFADIGLPGAGPRAVEDCRVLAGYIRDHALPIKPTCAARTHVKDVQAVIDVSQAVGIEIEVMAFIGSSPIRAYAEDWDLDLMLARSGEAIDLARRNGLPCTFVTEDTTRSSPAMLDSLFKSAIDRGAYRLCLCDTVGHSTPDGTRHLVHFTRELLDKAGRSDVGIDWHGHNDRGLAVANAVFAVEYGADRIHGTALGLGERVGNAALDQILVNLKLLGAIPDQDLSKLPTWCQAASRATGVPIPAQYPMIGADAFRTATGVHAAAIIKAERKGHGWLADRIYSGVPAGMFGREQCIEIGHYSGESNVVYWLTRRGHQPDRELVAHILGAAKRGNRVLTDGEIEAIVAEHQAGDARPS